MTLNKQWLSHADDGIQLIASGVLVASGNSSDFTMTSIFGESVALDRFGILLDITVQGGTQTSIDFDIEWKLVTKYVRVCRYNSVPGDGVVAQLLCPNVGTKPLPIGDARWMPHGETFRLKWTFNTPGGTPTITLSAHALGWGYRNNKSAWPGMR